MKKIISFLTTVFITANIWGTQVDATSFSTVSGDLDAVISYQSFLGGSANEPTINKGVLRLFNRQSPTTTNTIGGYITITAAAGYKISEIIWTNGINSTYTYSTDEILTNGTTRFPQNDDEEVNNNASIITNLNCSSITLYARGTSSTDRLYLKALSVIYDIAPSISGILADDLTINANDTYGEISYTINQTADGVTPTATLTSGDWVSNVQVDAENNKVTFSATENTNHEDRTATITISYTGAEDKAVTVTQKGVALSEIVDVTGPMTWNFRGYTTDISTNQNNEVILGNYVTLTTGDANALKGKQQYIVQDGYCWRGTKLTFHPTVAGKVVVHWTSASSSDKRTLQINDRDYEVPGGTTTSSYSSAIESTAFVPANEDVVLTGWEFNSSNGDYTSNQIRIWDISFTPAEQISDAGYASFSCASNFTISGAEAYKGTLVGNTLTITPLTGIIPANVGVILKKIGGGVATLTYTADAATADVENNNLTATLVALDAAAITVLETTESKVVTTLGLDSDGNVGFRKPAGSAIAANKAYLLVEASASLAPIRIIEATDEVTATENVETIECSKFIENGILYIKKNGIIYNAMGQIVK